MNVESKSGAKNTLCETTEIFIAIGYFQVSRFLLSTSLCVTYLESLQVVNKNIWHP